MADVGCDEAEKAQQQTHPLDGFDEEKCYSVMMAERTTLVSAKRESEDTLVRTIIQLSLALIVVLAGFIEKNQVLSGDTDFKIYCAVLIFFGFCLLSGLIEHWLSSKAYDQQIRILIEFYTKKSHFLGDSKISPYVRRAQTTTLFCFVLGLIALIALAAKKAEDQIRGPTSKPSNSTVSAVTKPITDERQPRQVGATLSATSPTSIKEVR